MPPEHLQLQVVLPATESIGPFWIDSAAWRSPGTPFSLLPAVTVSATSEETLRAILGRSGDLLGVGLLDHERADRRMSRPGRRRWSLRKPPSRQRVTSDPRNRDATGRFEEHLATRRLRPPGRCSERPCRAQAQVPASDPCGHRRRSGSCGLGRAPFGSPRLGDLLRAAEAGLLDGDPLRPYLILAVPGGDLGVIGTTWSAFEEAFGLVWEVVSAAGTAYSAAQAIEAIRARLGGAKEVIGVRCAEWSERGARPADLLAILGARPRSPREVAALLGCAEPEAEALLWGLGFEAADDGFWQAVVENDDELTVPLLTRSLLARTEVSTTEALRAEAEAALHHQSVTGEPGTGAHEEGARPTDPHRHAAWCCDRARGPVSGFRPEPASPREAASPCSFCGSGEACSNLPMPMRRSSVQIVTDPLEGLLRCYLQAMTKTELHRLVDALPDESLPAAAILLRRAQDPVVAKLEAAPLDDEELTDEDRRAIRSLGRSRESPGLRSRRS